ncbi:MAG: hypothetical protein IKW46_08235 [Bacteroidaceae bacterium]|nr:hypothetical protein [Bacteroidaceae bacterium]
MQEDRLNIKRVALEKIGNAIKIYHAKRSHVITGKIPVREFRKALRDGKVETTAPVATEDEYIIQLKTLDDVADEIRAIGGNTGEITVEDFEESIINLIAKLPAPKIEIVSAFGDDGSGETPTLTPLAKPTIKIEKVDSDVVEDEKPKPVALAPPEIIIDFVDSDSDVEEKPTIKPLDKPNIYIAEVSENEEDIPEVVIKKLDAPKIVIAKIDSETGEGEEIEIVQLAMPIIQIEKVDEDIEEDLPVITPLAKPNISVVEVTADIYEEQKPAIKALNTPDIKIEVLDTETDKEPEIIITSLAQPDITIERIEEEPEKEEDPTIQKLRSPEIRIEIDYARDEEAPTVTITKLTEPAIEIVKVIDIAKMRFDNYGIIDANGIVQNRHTWAGKAHSNIVAIADLVNGPNGYCVQDFDTTFPEYPKVLFFSAPHLLSFVGSLNVTDIGSKDTLTVEEIKQYANTLFGGAAYVAFNSDYEEEAYKEDFAYIMADADTYDTTVAKGVLKTPTIDIVPVEVGGEEEPLPVITQLNAPNIQLCIDKEDDTTSILGRAILGKAILGYGGI